MSTVRFCSAAHTDIRKVLLCNALRIALIGYLKTDTVQNVKCDQSVTTLLGTKETHDVDSETPLSPLSKKTEESHHLLCPVSTSRRYLYGWTIYRGDGQAPEVIRAEHDCAGRPVGSAPRPASVGALS